MRQPPAVGDVCGKCIGLKKGESGWWEYFGDAAITNPGFVLGIKWSTLLVRWIGRAPFFSAMMISVCLALSAALSFEKSIPEIDRQAFC